MRDVHRPQRNARGSEFLRCTTCKFEKREDFSCGNTLHATHIDTNEHTRHDSEQLSTAAYGTRSSFYHTHETMISKSRLKTEANKGQMCPMRMQASWDARGQRRARSCLKRMPRLGWRLQLHAGKTAGRPAVGSWPVKSEAAEMS